MDKNKIINIKITILTIIAIIMLTISITPKTLQEDTYYLIKVGEYIVNNGIDKGIEPFSFHKDLPYSYPHWLFNVIVYGVYNIGDFQGIYIFTIILAILLGIILYLATKKLYKNELISSILTLITIFLLTGFITARAQMIGFIAFALEIYNIEMLIKTGKKRNSIALVLIALMLANMYAASYPMFFILIMPYIAEYAVATINRKKHLTKKIQKLETKKEILKIKVEKEENKEKYNNKITKITKINNKILKIKTKIEKIRKTSNTTEKIEITETVTNIKEKQTNFNFRKLEIEKNKNVKLLIIVAIISLLAGLITPIGNTPYTYLIKTLKGNTTLFIAEHQPLTLISSLPTLIAIITSLLIIIFSKVKIKLREIIMLIGLFILSLSAQRQIAILTIVGLYIMTRIISKTMEIYKPNINEKIKNKITKFPYTIYTILAITIISTALYTNIVAGTEYIDKTSYPVEAVKWLQENIDTKNMRIFNSFNYGSYMLFKNIPVYIDGRADAYDPAFYKNKNPNDIFTDYMLVSSLQQDYEETFKKYEITHVILEQTENLKKVIEKDENYKEIYQDGNFIIYERNTGKNMQALEPEKEEYNTLYKNSDFAIYEITEENQELKQPQEKQYEADEAGTVTIHYDENGNEIQ